MAKVIIDTNVVLGHLIRGDTQLKEILNNYSEVLLHTQIVCETIFVLESQLKIPRLEIVEMIIKLLHTQKIDAERTLLSNTLYMYRDNPKLSLVDCLLICLADEGDYELMTYDKEILKKIAK